MKSLWSVEGKRKFSKKKGIKKVPSVKKRLLIKVLNIL